MKMESSSAKKQRFSPFTAVVRDLRTAKEKKRQNWHTQTSK
jgi:hypothetical protein